MRFLHLAALGTLLSGATAMAQTVSLNSLHHVARPLLIFSSPDDPRLAKQFTEISDHLAGAADRDMRVMVLSPQPASLPGTTPPLLALAGPAEQTELRQYFHIAPGSFTVILLGKDGGEKLRSNEPIPWNTLASTIDAMPMRQDEMKHDKATAPAAK